MKPAPFTYHRPDSTDAAVAMLSEFAHQDGRVLAGGQSLVPMMALRLAYPEHLIDINAIAELDRIAIEDGSLAIGALVRHAAFHRSVQSGPLGRLLTEAAGYIAHYPLRLRGTFCGSVAHADPAAEWSLVTVTLDGVLTARSSGGQREISAIDFFQEVMTTALEPDEILTQVNLPLLPSDQQFGFYEFNRRAGDFALAMSLVSYRLVDGRIVDPKVGVGGAEPVPRRLAAAEAELAAQPPNAATFKRAAEAAASVVEPLEDAQIPVAYRRQLVRTVVRRALEQSTG